MENRIALVTGAGGILGPWICRQLRGAGWRIVASDTTLEELATARALLGEEFFDHSVAGDLSERSFCRHLVAETERQWGPVSLLVNNAAWNPSRGPLEALDEDVAIGMFRVNVLAPLWLAVAARESLLRTSGAIVNISSAQTQGFLARNHLYVAGKAALEKLTETLAGEFLNTGVRVNALRVGRVPGPAFLRKHGHTLTPEALRELRDSIMPGHLEAARQHLGTSCVGTPQDIAEVVAFLGSPAARFLNGQIITLDGGALLKEKDWVGPSANDAVSGVMERWLGNGGKK